MAEYKTLQELRNYPLSNGETADLVKLISNNRPSSWVRAESLADLPVGTVAFVSAMGQMRRGVVVKVGRTKASVAITTQGAVDEARRFDEYHGNKVGSQPIRVQIVAAEPETVFIAPKPEPVQVKAEAPAFNPEAGASAPDANRQASQTGGVTEEKPEWLAQTEQVENWLAQHEAKGTPRTQWSAIEDGRLADHEEALEMDRQASDVWGIETAHAEALTLHSQAGKVDSMNNDENTTLTVTRETTGSAVVQLLEKVWSRIRENHPELPAVVIVTGAGLGIMGGKWGHFRANGWTAKIAEEGAATNHQLHEMFMAGETLAKGARQVLQTMLHEGAHTLARVREIQETSRQGRWHNAKFRELAGEMGLEYKHAAADKSIGFSQVTLTDDTLAEYGDLLDSLDREIHLMVSLPGYLGGDAGQDGGENMGKAPAKPTAPNTNNVKATCNCEEPNIIRLSRKVLDKRVVQCDDCDSLFLDRN